MKSANKAGRSYSTWAVSWSLQEEGTSRRIYRAMTIPNIIPAATCSKAVSLPPAHPPLHSSAPMQARKF